VPYEPGVLEVAAGGRTHRLATADAATAQVVRDDVELGDWLFSRLWLEDAAGTAVPCAGQEIDVTREGWQLVAAGSEGTPTAGAFAAPVVALGGQGALAIYQRV
jgi:hypothetical protein